MLNHDIIGQVALVALSCLSLSRENVPLLGRYWENPPDSVSIWSPGYLHVRLKHDRWQQTILQYQSCGNSNVGEPEK